MDIPGMLIYLTIMDYTPGPGNLMSMYLGADHGLRKTLRYIAGNVSVYGIKCLLCGLLNVALATWIPVLIPDLKWAGAGYMLYLAFSMIRSGFAAGQEKKETSWNGVAPTFPSGAVFQIANMKAWVLCLTVYSTYVIPVTTSAAVIVAVAVVNVVLCVGSNVLWALFGHLIHAVYHAHRKLFSVLFAAALAAVAVKALF